MKTWRIVILSGGIVAVSMLLFFSYQYFILENVKMAVGLNEKFGSTIVPITAFSLYISFFVMTLVAFPAFWFKSIPWLVILTPLLLRKKVYTDDLDKNDIIGLLISSLFIVLLVTSEAMLKIITYNKSLNCAGFSNLPDSQKRRFALLFRAR